MLNLANIMRTNSLFVNTKLTLLLTPNCDFLIPHLTERKPLVCWTRRRQERQRRNKAAEAIFWLGETRDIDPASIVRLEPVWGLTRGVGRSPLPVLLKSGVEPWCASVVFAAMMCLPERPGDGRAAR